MKIAQEFFCEMLYVIAKKERGYLQNNAILKYFKKLKIFQVLQARYLHILPFAKKHMVKTYNFTYL